MNIDITPSGYIIQNDLACIEFDIYESEVELTYVSILGVDVLDRLNDIEMKSIIGDIEKAIENTCSEFE